MTAAEFDTRRRLLGLSVQEAADWCGVQRRTIERWTSGYSIVAPEAMARLDFLERQMARAVAETVKLAGEKQSEADVVGLLRYRSQHAVDQSRHAAGLPLGAHAVLTGRTADALRAAGHAVEITWGDE